MEDHDAALAWAAAARTRRAEVVDEVAAGRMSLAAVLAARTDPLVAPIKLVVVAQAVPGGGKVVSRRALAALGLGDHRLADLSEADVARLLGALRSGDAG